MQRTVWLILCFLCTITSANAQRFSQEPPAGALRPGQRVLVDDGSCPSGQIKEVTGENQPGKPRFYRCVSRRNAR